MEEEEDHTAEILGVHPSRLVYPKYQDKVELSCDYTLVFPKPTNPSLERWLTTVENLKKSINYVIDGYIKSIKEYDEKTNKHEEKEPE